MTPVQRAMGRLGFSELLHGEFHLATGSIFTAVQRLSKHGNTYVGIRTFAGRSEGMRSFNSLHVTDIRLWKTEVA